MIGKRGRWFWFDMRIGGKRVRESLHTDERGLALERAKELRDHLLSPSAGQVRLDEFSTKYLEWAWSSHPASAKGEEYRLLKIESFCDQLGIQYLKDITPYHLEQLKAKLIADGRSKVTINRYLQLMRGLFYRAIDWEIYDKPNPLKKVRFYREEPCRRLLTQDEVKRILEAADAIASKPRSGLQRVFADIIRLAINTGLRKSELLNLRWSDVRGDEITVKGKGERTRTVPLNTEASDVIHRQSRRDAYVFGAPPANVGSLFRRTVERMRKDAGVSDFHFHLLRHVTASRLLEVGVDIVTIGSLLGHSRATTSLIYGHTDESRKRKAVDALPRPDGRLSAKNPN